MCRHIVRKFITANNGNIAIITGLMMLPMMGVIGLAIDYSQMSRHKGSLQQALDAAALATATQLGKSSNNNALQKFARDYFDVNLHGIDPQNVQFVYDKQNRADGFSMRLSASYRYDLQFGGLFGKNQQLISATALVKSGSDSIEIALVLDNSGSMRSNNRIGIAKKAAIALVDQLHAAISGGANRSLIQIGLVPFGGHVNVGAENRNKNWMDKTGLSPIHHENINWADNPRAIAQRDGQYKDTNGLWLTRFTLFDDMIGTSWVGCVEARPWPHHTQDTPASKNQPATLFVPTFAPDEPDDYSGQREVGSTSAGRDIYCSSLHPRNRCRRWNDGYRGNRHRSGVLPKLNRWYYARNWRRLLGPGGVPLGGFDGVDNSVSGSRRGRRIREERYQNSYLRDERNMPSGISARAAENTGTGVDQNKRQDWSWKYLNQRPRVSSFIGPNHGCTTRPITPLTANSGTIKSALNAMRANGLTNVPLGIVWGWRVLSAAPPFTQGRRRQAKNNQKIMIVMTDGNNYYGWQRTFNRSYYGAHGLQKNNRLFDHFEGVNNPRPTDRNYQKALDEHMLETCTNAKNSGIKIYTVAFDVRNGSSVKATLQSCASKSANTGKPLYFDASGSAQLLSAFERIASEVSQMRIAE